MCKLTWDSFFNFDGFSALTVNEYTCKHMCVCPAKKKKDKKRKRAQKKPHKHKCDFNCTIPVILKLTLVCLQMPAQPIRSLECAQTPRVGAFVWVDVGVGEIVSTQLVALPEGLPTSLNLTLKKILKNKIKTRSAEVYFGNNQSWDKDSVYV